MDIRRVSLRAIFISCLVIRGASKSFDVVWISPAEGAVYDPGDTIFGRWTATAAVVSPGFRLCEVTNTTDVMARKMFVRGGRDGGENEKCGTTIWPQVQETKDGYMITITPPEATEESEYCLEMQDDFGNVFTSPIFGLGAGAHSKKLTTSSATGESTTVAKESGTPVITVEAAKHSPLPSSTSTGEVAQDNSTVIPRIGVPTPSAQPDVLVSRRPVPTAAFAVPLSVVSSIVLIAGLLCVRMRRKMAQERERELKTLILSNRDPDQGRCASVGEVQRAFSVLSRKGLSSYSDSLEPVPVFMPPMHEPRLATRDPYAPMVTSISSKNIYGDHPNLRYDGPVTGKAKSLTAQYTAAGTISHPAESPPPMTIPPNLLPARLSPLYVRTESPGSDQALPVPPNRSLSPSSGDVYDAIAAKLGGGR